MNVGGFFGSLSIKKQKKKKKKKQTKPTKKKKKKKKKKKNKLVLVGEKELVSFTKSDIFSHVTHTEWRTLWIHFMLEVRTLDLVNGIHWSKLI